MQGRWLLRQEVKQVKHINILQDNETFLNGWGDQIVKMDQSSNQNNPAFLRKRLSYFNTIMNDGFCLTYTFLKSVSRIFDFSLFLEIWRLHWKLCSRVLLSSLKDNNPKITNRKNTNPGHPFQVQNICRSRSDIKETCWLKCVVL